MSPCCLRTSPLPVSVTSVCGQIEVTGVQVSFEDVTEIKNKKKVKRERLCCRSAQSFLTENQCKLQDKINNMHNLC